MLAHLLRRRLHKRSAKISCDGGSQQNFSALWARRPCDGGWIGAYVTMPDQLHLFVTTDDEKITLAARTKSLKNTISKVLRSTGVALLLVEDIFKPLAPE
ncbi:MAG: hypothetical protein DME69_00325 [Verrucomicrobia bacterium]|nr:MAG: hypothetical protein DME69_00325 [Verrucomicrobiota bacterium]